MSTENTTHIDNKDKQIIKGAENVYSFCEQWKTSSKVPVCSMQA